MKPWLSDPRGRQLEAFIGAWRIKTSQFDTVGDILQGARLLFDLPMSASSSIGLAADYLEALGKKERAIRARENLHLFGEKSEKASEAPITAEGLEKMMADSKPHLIDGASMDCVGELDIDPAKLLRKVVSAVISHGQGHILYDFPEVLAFFGSRIPDREELEGHTGVDERMFEAKAKWPNLDPSKAKRIETTQ
jgi:hypothetical protein